MCVVGGRRPRPLARPARTTPRRAQGTSPAGAGLAPGCHVVVQLQRARQLESVGTGLDGGVVGHGVGGQRGPPLPHRAQQVQRLWVAGAEGGRGRQEVRACNKRAHLFPRPHPTRIHTTTHAATRTLAHCGGLARAYAASSALQQTRLGVTRAACEKLKMVVSPAAQQEEGGAGVGWQATRGGPGAQRWRLATQQSGAPPPPLAGSSEQAGRQAHPRAAHPPASPGSSSSRGAGSAPPPAGGCQAHA